MDAMTYSQITSARLNTTLLLAPLIAFTSTINRSPKSKKCI